MTLLRALLCLAAGPVLFAASSSGPAVVPAGPPPTPTVIESGRAEMVSTEKESTFTFQGRVTVTATNLTLTCDELVVVAKRSGDPAATLGKQENFKSLVATGNVRILQGDREALCGKAEVFPGEDKVVLTQNPRVRMTDGSYEASGPRMILERGEKRALIEGEGPAGERPKILLPPLKDLGYEKDLKKKKSTPAPPAAEDTAPKAAPQK